MAGTQPKCGNGGVSDAVTSELGDRLLQYYGKSLEALLGVAYPGFRDNRSTLNTKTGFKKSLSNKTSLISFSWNSGNSHDADKCCIARYCMRLMRKSAAS